MSFLFENKFISLYFTSTATLQQFLKLLSELLFITTTKSYSFLLQYPTEENINLWNMCKIIYIQSSEFSPTFGNGNLNADYEEVLDGFSCRPEHWRTTHFVGNITDYYYYNFGIASTNAFSINAILADVLCNFDVILFNSI